MLIIIIPTINFMDSGLKFLVHGVEIQIKNFPTNPKDKKDEYKQQKIPNLAQ